MNSSMDHLNKHLFVTLLTAGVVLSCIARIFLNDSLNVWQAPTIAIGICLFCLVLYSLAARRDNIGLHNPDNLYYMGLLFTLSSLVYSLVTLFLLNSNADDVAGRVYNLIGSFGIALVSTFAGILFRILLLQKPDAGTLSEQQVQLVQHGHTEFNPQNQFAHQSLTEAAFKLRRELTQTIADMSVFRRAIVQASNETVQEADKARTAMIQQVKKAAHEQTRILSTLSATTVDKLTASIGEIVASIEKMQSPLEKLDHSIHDLSTKITGGGEKMETTFNAVLESLQGVVHNLQSTSGSTQNIVSQMEQMANTLTASTQAFSGSLAEATKVTPQYTQQLEQSILTLRKEAEQWRSMTQEVRSSLVQAIERLTQIV